MPDTLLTELHFIYYIYLCNGGYMGAKIIGLVHTAAVASESVKDIGALQ